MPRAAALIVLVGIGLPSLSVAANRCTDARGKVTYQDTACEGAARVSPVDTSNAFSTKPGRVSPAAPTAQSSSGGEAYANARGSWRGPAQFQLSVSGVRDGEAQTISPMVLELKPDGEVAGIIPSAGCKASGLTTQFVAPYIAHLDVSLKGCTDARFNGRYNGYLHSSVAAKEAKLNLHALTTRLPAMKMQQASLEAVLKR